MAQKVYAVVSQKGGAGKTSTAVSLALSFAKSGKKTLLADFDASQARAYRWFGKREAKLPNLTVVKCQSVRDLASEADKYQVIIIDGAPHASKLTRDLAEFADKIIIPSMLAESDLEVAVELAVELQSAGIDKGIIGIALVNVMSKAEQTSATAALAEVGLPVISGIKYGIGFYRALDVGRGYQEATHPSHKAQGTAYIEALRRFCK